MRFAFSCAIYLSLACSGRWFENRETDSDAGVVPYSIIGRETLFSELKETFNILIGSGIIDFWRWDFARNDWSTVLRKGRSGWHIIIFKCWHKACARVTVLLNFRHTSRNSFFFSYLLLSERLSSLRSCRYVCFWAFLDRENGERLSVCENKEQKRNEEGCWTNVAYLSRTVIDSATVKFDNVSRDTSMYTCRKKNNKTKTALGTDNNVGWKINT